MIHFLIMHVTVLLIVAFFVLFAASKSEGAIALFGYVLGIWLLIVAALHVVAWLVPGFMGMKSPDMVHTEMHRGPWMHHWGQEDVPMQTAPAQPAPAAPAKH